MKNTRKLIPNTKVFLRNSIHDKCLRNGLSGKRKPYFLRGDGAQIYSIAHGLEKNKTIIFHPNIGWDAEYLKAQILKLDSSIDLLRTRSNSSCSSSSESAEMNSVCLSGERSCAAAIAQPHVSRSRRSVFFMSVLSVCLFRFGRVRAKIQKICSYPVKSLQSWAVNLKRI